MRLLEVASNVKARLLGSDLREQIAVGRNNEELLSERLAELELALEDASWVRQTAEGTAEFSRDGLRRIIALSRLAFLKNPIIKRAVMVQVYYVLAQGVQIKCEDQTANEVIQGFLDDPLNRAELTSAQAMQAKEARLQYEGNLFFALFTNASTGEVQIRTIPVDEISDIVTNPDDRKEVWLYRRDYVRQEFNPASGVTTPRQVKTYYKDWNYQGEIDQVDGQAVEEAVVFHVRVGGLDDMRFGLPETYDALDWARAYKDFLSDWATIVKSYARFAWQLVTKGGKNAIAGAKQKLGTTLGVSSTGYPDKNPPPVVGSVFAGNETTKIDAVKTSGATTKAEDGRRLLLMVAASCGLPETFFGDVSVGTLATARSLDRPTELKFRARQGLWQAILGSILEYVLRQACEAPSGPLAGQDPADIEMSIDFPPILEHDVAETINAIVAAATLNGNGLAGTIEPKELVKMILTALGVQNQDEVLAEMFPNNVVPPYLLPRDPAPDAKKPLPGKEPGSNPKQAATGTDEQ